MRTVRATVASVCARLRAPKAEPRVIKTRTVRAFTATAVATSLLLAVTSCSTGSAETASTSTSASSTSSASASAMLDTTVLTGTWVVTNTGTAADGTTVTLSAEPGKTGSATIVAACGTVDGVWGANADGMFLGSVTTWTASCETSTSTSTSEGVSPQIVAWFTTATTYSTPSDGSATVTFANSAKANIATLVALQSPSVAESAPLSSDQSASGESPTSTPPPIATVSDLEGKWVQEGRPQVAPTPPYIEFDSDGTWSGSDGCNATSGRWLLTDSGSILATAGPTTLISCTGMVSLGTALTEAQYVSITDDTLYLWKANGSEIIRLVPEKATASESAQSAAASADTAASSSSSASASSSADAD